MKFRIGISPDFFKQKFVKLIFTVILLVLLLVGSVSASNWSMFRGDLTRRGVSDVSAIINPELVWNFSTGMKIGSSPVIVEGVVYFSADNNTFPNLGRVYALNVSDGSLIWYRNLSGYSPSDSQPLEMLDSSPMVVEGIMFIGGGNTSGCLYKLDITDGSHLWDCSAGEGKLATKDGIIGSPAYHNSRVFIGNRGRSFRGLNMDGSVAWYETALAGGVYLASPLIVDGMVIVCIANLSGQTDIKAFNESVTGKSVTIWSYSSGGIEGIVSTPSVLGDYLYVGSLGPGDGTGELFALNVSNGTQLWNFTFTGYAESSSSVYEGKVFFGISSGVLFCLNATTGVYMWNYTTGDAIVSSPTIASGVLYVGSNDDKLYALNTSDGSLIWNYTVGGDILSSPAIANSSPTTLIVGSFDGILYAFQEGGDSTPPNITINWPPTKIATKDKTPNINFTATDDIAITLSCSLYINGVLNSTNSSVISGMATIITPTGDLSNGWVNWSIICDDGSGNSGSSSVRYLQIKFFPFLEVSASVAITIGYLIYRRFRRGRR